MKKRALGAAVGFAFALVAVTAPASAAALQASESAPTYMNAVVVSTDAAASTLTVRPKGRPAETLRLEGPLAGRLGELKAGDEVILTLQGGRVLDLKRPAAAAKGPTRPRRPVSPPP